MVGTTGWLTASYDFLERVLLRCRGLIQELIAFCTKQNEQNTMLKAENTSLQAENAILKARIAELEARAVPSVPTDDAAPAAKVPSVPIDGAASAADVSPVPGPKTDAPPETDDEAAAGRKAKRTRIRFAAYAKTSHHQVGKNSSATVDLVPYRNTPRIRTFMPRRSKPTTPGGARSITSYHHKTLKQCMDSAIAAGARVGGKRARPPEDDVVKLNDYKAAALLEGMDNSLRAAMIRGLKPRIKRIVYRKRVYEQALRLYRDKVCQKRQKITNKIRAAVALGATSGSLKAYKSIRALEREITGQPSAVPGPEAVAEAVRRIWDDCTTDLHLTPLRNGHMANIRSVLELEYHNYLTGSPTRARHVYKTGGTRAAPLTLIETKVVELTDVMRAEFEGIRRWQDSLVVKITWDARQVSADKHQVEIMLLIIPDGAEGQNYCQSCLRIRTVMVITGKDSQENLQANFTQALEQVKEIAKNGLRYSAAHRTFLGQASHTPLFRVSSCCHTPLCLGFRVVATPLSV